jgi:hypothetical protein
MTRDVLPLVMCNGYPWANRLARLEVRREPGRTVVTLAVKRGERLTPKQRDEAYHVAANLGQGVSDYRPTP